MDGRLSVLLIFCVLFLVGGTENEVTRESNEDIKEGNNGESVVDDGDDEGELDNHGSAENSKNNLPDYNADLSEPEPVKKGRVKLIGLNYTNTEEPEHIEEKGVERPLTVGDTFTPPELLPVAEKLMAKVDEPGEGKGFVSSAQRPEDLADKLFQTFFLTEKRIVILNEFDVSGLDALQALALSGEAITERSIVRTATEAYDQVTLSVRGQKIAVNTEPKKSQYLLMKKVDNRKIKKKIVIRRGGINLAKKLNPKRHLVVKTGRRNIYHKGQHNRKKNKKSQSKNNKAKSMKQGAHLHRIKSIKNTTHNKTKSNEGTNTKQHTRSRKDSACHWMYECEDPRDIDTCRLKTKCDTKVDFHGIPHQPDEHSASLRTFRKMLGIALVDEEVEKILERRLMRLNSQPNRAGVDIERVETLAQYFDKIVESEKEPTTPLTTMPADDDEPGARSNEVVHLVDPEGEPDRGNESKRRNMNKPTRSTTERPVLDKIK